MHLRPTFKRELEDWGEAQNATRWAEATFIDKYAYQCTDQCM